MPISVHTNYDLDPANPTYEGEWKRLLKVAENEPLWLFSLGFGGSADGLRPHFDQGNKGSLAIGYGYDFAQNKFTAVADLRAAGAVIADEALLQAAVDGLTRGSATPEQRAALAALVFLPDEAAATRLLELAVSARETQLDRFLLQNQIVLGESRERATLLSMWYQAPGGGGQDGYFRRRNDPITNMVRALQVGNRAEAWFEIRYGSSNNGKNGLGVVIRRYAESEVFGLYDAASVSASEAIQTYRMLTVHRDQILSYESRFGVALDGALGTDRVVAYSNLPPLYAANERYRLTGTSGAVKSPHESFEPAKVALIQDLEARYPSIAGTLTASDYHYAAIQVDPGRDPNQGPDQFDPNHVATLISTEYDTTGNEREVKNILMGEGGDDFLLGGKGDDLLIGGTGFDTYYYRTGDGNDRILDEDRQGQIIIDDVNYGPLFAGGYFAETAPGSNVWKSPDGRITLTHNSPWTLATPDGAGLDLGDTLNDGDFGIDLVEAPQDVATTRTILGDLTPVDADSVEPGIQIRADDLGNPVLSGSAEPGRPDGVVDSGGPDLVQVGAGNDVVNAFRGGADTIQPGAGRDKVWAGDGDDVVESGTDADIVSGGAGKDRLYADSRVDTAAAIAAGSGAGSGLKGDWLAGGAGEDIVVGGADNDALFGGEAEDLLIGGAGDDVLNGDDDYLATSFDWTVTPDAPPLFDAIYTPVDVLTPPPYAGGADTIYAGAGNDFASGLFGDDVIYGEAGEDTISGDDGDDVLIGGADNDRITGDYGALAYESNGVTVVQGDDYIDGGEGDDWLQGEAGDDLIYGGDGSDQLYGDAGYLDLSLSGADYLDGEAGVDYLSGQGGDDTLLGGTEGDYLYGDAGADFLDGGSGADHLEGGSEADALYGGTEADTLLGDAGEDLLDGGDGDDLLSGGDDADTLIGGAGADTMIGGLGDDAYQVNLAEGDRVVDDQGGNVIALGDAPDPTSVVAGSATVDGQPGILIKTDPLSSTGLFVQGGLVLLDASNPTYQSADGSEVEHSLLMDTVFTEALTLTGTSIGDALKGYAGADLIQGLAGDDWLTGGAADDVLEGGDGDDELIGGAGADTLRGGLGDDTYTVDAPDAVEELADEGVDTVLADFSYTLADNVERLTLTGDAAVDATGNALANTLTGNAAANVLEGGAGDDALAGGAGDDEYVLALGDGFDTIDDALGVNAVRFGAGIDPASLTVSQFVGDDGATYLEIGYGSGGDSVAIRDGLLGHVGQYRFADGTVRTHEDVLASLGALAVAGSAADDVIIGGAGPDVIDGGGGADQLFGRDADDLLKGGDGNDALSGDAGNDVLDGGAGADALTGGEGEDTYLVTWGMGADSITEDAGGLNHLRLGTAVEFEDLVTSRSGDDLMVSLRGGSNRVSIAGYYAATQDWLVTDSAAETRTLAEVIAQSPSGPPDPVETEIQAYKERVQREFYSTQNFSVLSGGQLGRSVSHVTSTFTDTTVSIYALQEVLQASDDAFITRGTPSSDLVTDTTVSESTITVYSIEPGSRTVADALAANGALNNGTWRYVPIETIVGVPLGSLSNRIGVAKEAGRGSSSPLPYFGIWEFTPNFDGGAGELPTLSNPVARTVTLTDYRTEETLTLNLEEIRAGSADSFIQTGDYSVVDAGAGNDVVSVASAPDYVLPDGSGSPGRIGSFLYGNDGDDSLTGGDGNDALVGGAGFDSLDGGAGADQYLGAGDGEDYISDAGEDLERYLETYYTLANFPDLVLRERHGGQYYDKVDADFMRGDDGIVQWGNPDVEGFVDFFDAPEDGLAGVVSSLEFQLRSLRDDYVELLRWDGTGTAPTDDSGRTAGEVAREIRAVEQQIPLGQANYLQRFIYVEPLPPPPEVAGNDYAAIEPYYGDVVWVDKVVLDDKWSPSNLMVSTDVVDGEPEELTLSHPDGDSFTIGLALAEDPVGTGIEMVQFADGTALTIRQVLDLENQDRTLLGTDNADVLTGGRGSDTLIGLAGDDYLAGGAGDDLLQGGEGSDSYDYERDTGSDIIEDLDTSGTAADGVFLIGIAPDEVTATSDSGYLRFAFTGSTDGLSIRWDPTGGYGVEEVAFEDGTVWDAAYIESLLPGGNQAPTVAAPIADQNAPEDAPFAFAVPSGTFEDADAGDTLQLSVALASGGALPAWLTFDPQTGSFAGTPGNADVGTVEIRVTATDPSGESVSDVFALNVVNVNDAPVLALALADLATEERAAFVWTLPAGTFSDIDPGEVLSYSVSLASGAALPAWLAFNPATATLSGTPGESDIGALAIRIRATDTAGATAEDSFELSVTPKPGQSFTGTGGVDTIVGTDGADVVNAGVGADTAFGNAGQDALYGEDGNDALYGGTGDDLLDGGGGADKLYGDDGVDTLSGGLGNDELWGGGGNDELQGGDNADLLRGEAGEDRLLGGAGNDQLWGGTGQDELWGGDNADILRGEDGDDLLYGEDGGDELYGGLGQDYLTAGTGADALEGNEGVDLLQGGAGNDSLLGGADNDLVDPGANSDIADGGDGGDFIVAGTGPDTLAPGAGADVIAYNRGDGQDDVNPGTGAEKTVSLGGGILYADLALRKNANDLVLETGGTESLTFKNWYAAPANQQFVTLQVIAEAMAGYDSGSTDLLLNKKVQSFDFAALAGAFNAARTADPLLTRWELMNALLDTHLAASDDAALGGDLAYQYGLNGTLAGIGTGPAQDVVGSAQFGVQAQQLRPLSTLQEGPVKLGA